MSDRRMFLKVAAGTAVAGVLPPIPSAAGDARKWTEFYSAAWTDSADRLDQTDVFRRVMRDRGFTEVGRTSYNCRWDAGRDAWLHMEVAELR